MEEKRSCPILLCDSHDPSVLHHLQEVHSMPPVVHCTFQTPLTFLADILDPSTPEPDDGQDSVRHWGKIVAFPPDSPEGPSPHVVFLIQQICQDGVPGNFQVAFHSISDKDNHSYVGSVKLQGLSGSTDAKSTSPWIVRIAPSNEAPNVLELPQTLIQSCPPSQFNKNHRTMSFCLSVLRV